jgi:CRP-like cAMP-binding protein
MLTTRSREVPAGLLGTLTTEELDDLVRRARPRRFARGAVIVDEGERPRRVAAILSGRAKISCITEDGREVLLGALGTGDLVGELSALDGEPCSATVTTLEPVDALVLSPAGFTEYLDAHPRLTRILFRSVMQKLRDADRKRVEFGSLDAEGRVARRLVELASEHGTTSQGVVHITLPLSQQELAGWTCSSRESVSKALRNLRACGWIETHRRGISVLDVGALNRRAGVSGHRRDHR